MPAPTNPPTTPSEPITVPFHSDLWLDRRFNIAAGAGAMPFTAGITQVSLVVTVVGGEVDADAGKDFLDALSKGDVDPAKAAERALARKAAKPVKVKKVHPGSKRARREEEKEDEAEEGDDEDQEVEGRPEKPLPARAEKDHFALIGILRSGKELCLAHLIPEATPPMPSSSRAVMNKDGVATTANCTIVAKARAPLRLTYRHNPAGSGRARDHLIAMELRRCSGYALPVEYRVTAVLHGAQTIVLSPQQLSALSGAAAKQ